MKYEKFIYLYPPRPEVKTTPALLDSLDTGEYVANPKYNGTACMIFTNGSELYIYNRHKQALSNYSKVINWKGLSTTGNWFVYAGEYLNKGKSGEHNIKEKDKYIIWDILVYDGVYLIGRTLRERITLLELMFPCTRAMVSSKGMEVYDHLCFTPIEGIYKTPSYTDGFKDLYEELIKTDLYEGVVLKKLESKLTYGFNSRNNHDWQLKIRKPTKLYNF